MYIELRYVGSLFLLYWYLSAIRNKSGLWRGGEALAASVLYRKLACTTPSCPVRLTATYIQSVPCGGFFLNLSRECDAISVKYEKVFLKRHRLYHSSVFKHFSYIKGILGLIFLKKWRCFCFSYVSHQEAQIFFSFFGGTSAIIFLPEICRHVFNQAILTSLTWRHDSRGSWTLQWQEHLPPPSPYKDTTNNNYE